MQSAQSGAKLNDIPSYVFDLLVTCYLYVDGLEKHQLLVPTSFQWSSRLYLNWLTEVDVTT